MTTAEQARRDLNRAAIEQELSALAESTKAAQETIEKNKRRTAELAVLKAIPTDLDYDKLARASRVIYMAGKLYDAEGNRIGSERWGCLREAETAIGVHRGGLLRSEFFGTKSYDRWTDQGSNCSYGMCPRHGMTVFEIGLVPEVRKRELTDPEIEAALYAISALQSGALTGEHLRSVRARLAETEEKK